MSVKIYHNPRCSKSRQTLELLEKKGLKPEVVLYLDNPPKQTELKDILGLLKMNAADLIRKNEDLYKELNLKNATEAQLLKAMSTHPKLIERPIVIKGKKAVLGRPPENVNKIL